MYSIIKVLKGRNSIPRLCIIAVELFLIFFFIIPYFIKGSVYSWDAAGHYFSAWYTKTYLFPVGQIFGWNPYHFWGYPQNQFYPPLFTLIVAFFGNFIPLGLAFKIVLSIIVLATPLSFYYFLATFGINKIRSAYIMLLMSAIFIFYPEIVGGNLISTFNGGVVANALAVPLLFLYLSLLNLISKRKDMWIICSIVLALVILSHIFYAVAAIILSLGYFFVDADKLRTFIKHYTLAFLLSAFWALPFILKIIYTTKFNSQVSFSYLVMPIVSFFLIIYYIKKGSIMKEICFGLIILLTLIFFVGLFNMSYVYIQRFNFIFFLFNVIFLSFMYFNWNSKKKEVYLFLLLVILVYPLFLLYSEVSVKPLIEPVIDISPATDGRIFIAYAIPHYTLISHLLQHKLPIENNSVMAMGVFFESGRNSKITLDMLYAFDSYYSKTNNGNITKNQINNMDKKLGLLDITYIYSTNFTRGLIKKNALIVGDKKLNLYKVSEKNPVMVIDYDPAVIEKNWDQHVRWWVINSSSNKIFVNQNIPIADYEEKASIRDFSFSDNFQKISFVVESNKRKNVYIKQSHFPNWKAYENGKEIPIYLASPYFMLIQGKGVIELKYERLPIDIFSWILTLAGIMFVVYYLILKSAKS